MLIRLLIMLISLGLVGCGLVEDMGKQCGGSLKEVCHMIFGYNSSDIKQNEINIEELKKRLSVLEAEMNSSINLINILQDNITSGVTNTTLLQNQISVLQNNVLQTQTDIIELQSQDSVVEYIDPCEDGTGFDEIILKTSSNKLVVYFENGSTRFLTTLIPGLYKTTDASACQFSVQSNMEVISLGSTSGPVLVYSEPFSEPQTGLSLTCIAPDTAALGRSKVRIRSQINQNVLVEKVGGVSTTIEVKAGTNTFVTFPNSGTIKATPALLGTTQTKACN